MTDKVRAALIHIERLSQVALTGASATELGAAMAGIANEVEVARNAIENPGLSVAVIVVKKETGKLRLQQSKKWSGERQRTLRRLERLALRLERMEA